MYMALVLTCIKLQNIYQNLGLRYNDVINVCCEKEACSTYYFSGRLQSNPITIYFLVVQKRWGVLQCTGIGWIGSCQNQIYLYDCKGTLLLVCASYYLSYIIQYVFFTPVVHLVLQMYILAFIALLNYALRSFIHRVFCCLVTEQNIYCRVCFG